MNFEHPWVSDWRLESGQITNVEPVRYTAYIRPGQTAATNQFMTPRGDDTFLLVPDTPQQYRIRSNNGTDSFLGGRGARFVRLWGLDDNYEPLETTVSMNGTQFVTIEQPFFRLFGAEVVITGYDFIEGSVVGNVGFVEVRPLGNNTRLIEIPPQRGIGYTGLYTGQAGYETFFKTAQAVGISTASGSLGVWVRERENPTLQGENPPKILRYLSVPSNRVPHHDPDFNLIIPPYADVQLRCMEGSVRGSFELRGFRRQVQCNDYKEIELP